MFAEKIILLFVFLKDPKDTPPPTRVETRDERKERKVSAKYLRTHG